MDPVPVALQNPKPLLVIAGLATAYMVLYKFLDHRDRNHYLSAKNRSPFDLDFPAWK